MSYAASWTHPSLSWTFFLAFRQTLRTCTRCYSLAHQMIGILPVSDQTRLRSCQVSKDRSRSENRTMKMPPLGNVQLPASSPQVAAPMHFECDLARKIWCNLAYRTLRDPLLTSCGVALNGHALQRRLIVSHGLFHTRLYPTHTVVLSGAISPMICIEPLHRNTDRLLQVSAPLLCLRY